MIKEKKETIGEILLRLGYLQSNDLEAMLSSGVKDDKRFAGLCLEDGYINEDQLAKALAEQFEY